MQGNTYLICNSNLKRLQLYNSRLWIWKRKPSNRREGKIGDGLLCLCTYVSVTPHSFNLFCDCLWSTSWMPSTVLGVRDSKALPTRCSEIKMRIAFKPKLQCLLWDHCRVTDIHRVHEFSTEALSSTLNFLISFSSEKWDGILTNLDSLIKDASWVHGVHLRQQHAERIHLDSEWIQLPATCVSCKLYGPLKLNLLISQVR